MTSTPDSTVKRRDDLRLGEILRENGTLSDSRLNEALAEQARLRTDGDKVRLGDILIRLGLCSFEQVSAAISVQGARPADPSAEPSRPKAAVGPHGTIVEGPSASRETISSSSPSESSSSSAVARMPPEVAAIATDPKRCFGKYVLLEELGRGGMGVVHKAWDGVLGRIVALKRLRTDGVDDTETARFIREAQTAASLNHPGIVPVWELGEEDGEFFIAMKFIEGEALNRKRLPWKKACTIARNVALALAYAHDQGIVHRDVKPHNIILEPGGHPYLGDFGLARSMRGHSTITQTGFVVGTPAYMPPEQACGETAHVGKRSDVYGLGATLYELVTGHPPFVRSTPVATLRAVVEEDTIAPTSLVSDLPPDVETIIFKAMEKNPAHRYRNAKAMADDLARACRQERIHARPRSLVTRISRALDRQKLLAWSAGLALAAVVLAGLLLGWQALDASARVDAYRIKGEGAFASGRWSEAREWYGRAFELAPSDGAISERLRACDERIRGQEEARARLLAESATEETAAAEARQRQGELREQIKPLVDRGRQIVEQASRDLYRPGADLVRTRAQLADAIAVLDEAEDLFDGDHEVPYWRARARALQLDWTGAIADYDLALERRPDFGAALLERGKIALSRAIEELLHMGWQLGPTAEARVDPWLEAGARDLRAALEAGGVENEDYAEALLAFAERRLPECIAACDRVIEAEPSREEPWRLRADARHFAAGDGPGATAQYEAAIADYDRAIALRANYYEALIMRGYERQIVGDFPGAREDYDRALALRPGDPLGLWFRAAWHLKQAEGRDAGRRREHLERAIDLLGRGIEVRPDSFILRMNRAMALGNTGQLDAAVADVTRALELNPDHHHGWYLKGSIEAQQGDQDVEALVSLERALEINPGFASAWFNKGVIHRRRGEIDDAIDALRNALGAGHPEEPLIRRLLAELAAGSGGS